MATRMFDICTGTLTMGSCPAANSSNVGKSAAYEVSAKRLFGLCWRGVVVTLTGAGRQGSGPCVGQCRFFTQFATPSVVRVPTTLDLGVRQVVLGNPDDCVGCDTGRSDRLLGVVSGLDGTGQLKVPMPAA